MHYSGLLEILAPEGWDRSHLFWGLLSSCVIQPLGKGYYALTGAARHHL